ncbi:MAG TPA: tRNA pseudouridine(55) synthase TruB [Chitinophagaceae bacterium]|nr:MAG: tRNA pseudouridine synthase B [Bacteroidetes bacterium OLB11]HMN32062.1 tRNA pseudouridine(55) synthase TruB [Chitinophagaceae bacterium]
MNLTREEIKEGATLLLDKPYGWTSFGLITQIKRWTKSKIGHAGTLDPLASGLMICCTGKFTKKLTGFIGLPKEYTGIITIGHTTDTYDLESFPQNNIPISHVSNKLIFDTAQKFTGEIEQFPPIHSAIKKEGTPVYKLARKGEPVEMKSRKSIIAVFEITKINLPDIYFKVSCSSGTYIRSLANDFGKELGTGAYLKSLRRTKIGDFKIEDALSIEELSNEFGALMNVRIIQPKIEIQ